MENITLEYQPENWVCYICGQYFKISKFNRVLVWRNNEWTSTRGTTIEDVYNAIEEKNKDILSAREKRKYVTHERKNLPIKPSPIVLSSIEKAIEARRKNS